MKNKDLSFIYDILLPNIYKSISFSVSYVYVDYFMSLSFHFPSKNKKSRPMTCINVQF